MALANWTYDMPDWSRLSKLAGMLGSPHDGERVNAARLLEQALQRAGLTFADLAQRIEHGGSGAVFGRTVVVERWKPNPASQVARKIIHAGGARLTKSERAFLDDIVRSCEMASTAFVLKASQLEWLTNLEKIYVLGTMSKFYPRKNPKPVTPDMLDELGLGEKAGTYTGEPEPRYKRTPKPYRPRARMVDDTMPDARDDIETKGNSAWAARKVDLEFDDDIGF